MSFDKIGGKRRKRKSTKGKKMCGGGGIGYGNVNGLGQGGATGYESRTVGNLNQQENAVFGPGNTSQSNALPNPMNHRQPLGIKFGGASRKRKGMKHSKRKSHRRSKRGGYFGAVLSQAAVPFSILAMQQSYRNKKQSSKNRSRRNRH